MALWKAVLLVNLALAFGVTAGWVRWGREAVALRRELAAAPAAVIGVEREFRGEGVVRAVLGEATVLVITHGDIPGYMPPMTMGFRAAAPALLDGVQVGDGVRFVLRGTFPNLQIVALEKTP